MIIGITGKAGSGKTTLSNLFVEKYDLIKFDCDSIAKDLQSRICFEIHINEHGFIDKKEQHRIINEFHPLVWNEIEDKIKVMIVKNKSKDIVVETALPTYRFFDIVNISFCIKSELCIERLKKLRLYSDEKIDSIIESQKYYDKFYGKCDFMIDNNEKINTAFYRLCDIYDNIKGKDD